MKIYFISFCFTLVVFIELSNCLYSQSLSSSFVKQMLKIDSTIMFDSIKLNQCTYATTYIRSRITDSTPHITWGLLDTNTIIGVSQNLFSKGMQILDVQLLAYLHSSNTLIVFQNFNSEVIFPRKSFILMELLKVPSYILIFDSTLNLQNQFDFFKFNSPEEVIVHRFICDKGVYYSAARQTSLFAEFINMRNNYYQNNNFIDLLNLLTNINKSINVSNYQPVKYTLLIERYIDKKLAFFIKKEKEIDPK